MFWRIDLVYWLAHSVLAGFVILAVGCAAMRLCREPVRRLRLAELTLLGCLLAPGMYLVPGLPHFSLGWLGDAAAPPVPPVEEPAALARESSAPVEAAVVHPVNHAGTLSPEASRESSTDFSAPTYAAFPVPTPQLLVTAYLALAGCLAAWRLVGAVRLWQLSRTTYPASEAVAAVFEQVAGPVGLRVRLVASDRIDLPITFGWLRPVIVLPGSLCRAANDPALRDRLAHEWSHVERRDIVSWHLAGVVQVLFFYHPLFWWLRRQLRLCQDYLADARAAEEAEAPEDYAEYLVGLARRRIGSSVPFALGVGDRRSNLYRRVLMLINTRQPLELPLPATLDSCRPRWASWSCSWPSRPSGSTR